MVVAYDETWLMPMLRSVGFDEIEIRKGHGRGGSYAGQDVVIMKMT